MVWSIAFAATFVVSCFAAIYFAAFYLESKVEKLAVLSACLALIVGSYVFASSSGASPFAARTAIGLGTTPTPYSVLLGVCGAVLGVIGSIFFKRGKRDLRLKEFVRPLSVCPMTLIPVIKLIESSSEQDLLAFLLLFCLSYQTGFFWDRLLKEAN